MIKLMLVDDQKLFIKSLKRVIESLAEEMTVIGIASDGEDALKQMELDLPDILLLDVRMPGMDGVETARIVAERFPQVQVVMLTTFDNDDYIKEAMKYGAVGYILKDIEPLDLIASIRAIASGSVLISQSVASKLFKQIQNFEDKGWPDKVPASESIPPWMKSLSPREREVLELIAKGLTNQQISDTLFIAEQTVRNHVSIIYSKLGVHNRLMAMQMVIKDQVKK